jgi:hypothetical protein
LLDINVFFAHLLHLIEQAIQFPRITDPPTSAG